MYPGTITAINKQGMNALLLATTSGQLDMVTYLLQSGASILARDSNGSTALQLAAAYGHAAIAQQLISYHSDTSSVNSLGWGVLDYCYSNEIQTQIQNAIAKYKEKEFK